MLAIGLDVHQQQTAVAALDMDTGEVRQSRVSTGRIPQSLAERPCFLRQVAWPPKTPVGSQNQSAGRKGASKLICGAHTG
jgi:hypothetical protein